jgi:hypothetical protein
VSSAEWLISVCLVLMLPGLLTFLVPMSVDAGETVSGRDSVDDPYPGR